MLAWRGWAGLSLTLMVAAVACAVLAAISNPFRMWVHAINVTSGVLAVSAGLIVSRRRSWPAKDGRCAGCGYELAGLPRDVTVCPECEVSVDERSVKRPRWERVVAVLAAWLGVGYVVIALGLWWLYTMTRY